MRAELYSHHLTAGLIRAKRWKAIGQGVRKSKHDLTEEIRSLEDDRYPRDLRELIAKAYGEPIQELEGEPR